MKLHLKLRFLVSTLVALALSLVVLPAPAAPNTAVAHGIGSAPAGLVAAIAHTQAREAAQNPAYAIGKNGCAALPAGSKGATLTGCFAKTGPAFSTGKQTLHLQLSAWGRAGHLRPVSPTRLAPRANRIVYRGQRISEWWRVLPLGYEQGFTIEQAPAGTGKVVLELSAGRAPKIVHGTLAWGTLRYGKLHVVDATGKVLPATLSAQGKTITLAFDAAHARYPVTVDPLVWVQQQEVTDAAGAASAEFGTSVALSGNGTTALVGAYQKAVSSNSSQGAAYVYTLAGGTWSQVAELTASNGEAYDAFGYSVALSADGTTALVGADGKTVGTNSYQGAAYVYTEPSGGWVNTATYTAELIVSNGVSYEGFGSSVALSSNGGTTALVGDSAKTVNGNNGQGAAYVFTTTDNWTTNTQVELTALGGAQGDAFGYSVALSASGATALVGAEGATAGGNILQGAAYVYTEPNGGWASTAIYTAELIASDGAQGDYFGNSVALSANGATALVGAWNKTINVNAGQGAAYVYALAGGWSQAAELIASDGASGDHFGISVALSVDGTTALVGAPDHWGNNPGVTGAAYVYTLPGGTWSQAAELTAVDGAKFGTSVALSANGTTALVGAPHTIVTYSQQGVAYFFGGFGLSAVLGAPATVQINTQFPSQYILTNASTTASAALVVSLPLPATGAGYVSASASQGTCSYDSTAKVATCALGSIPGNGGTASATLNLTATGAAGSTIAQSGQLANASPDLAQTASTTIVLPPPPTLSGLGNVTVTAPNAGTEAFTLAGTGTLTVTATSSNTALLPNANITGASSCTAAGSCTLTLTPTGSQTGSTAVTITVTDAYSQSAAGAFTFTVQPAPTAPTANNLSLTTYENSAISANLSAGAPNGDTLSYAVTQPTHGTVTVSAGTGAFTYTPTSGYSGSDSFTFKATDTVTTLVSNTATVSITVNPTPPPGQVPPVASNLTLTTYTGQALSGTLPAVVTPSSDTLSYAIAAQPTNGTVTVNAGTGAFTYTPASGYSGSDSFTFKATDTVTGLVSNTATVSITVNAVPPPGQVPPVASNLTLTTYTGQALSGTLPAVVTPSSDTLSYAGVAQPTHGAVTVNAGTGAFTYTPTSGYSGSDSFTFKATDTVTTLVSNTATVSITVKKAPPSGGGGGFGPLALFGLLLLALVPWWLRHRGFRSTPTQSTENIPMKPHVKLRFLVSTLAALALGLAALPALAASGPGTVDPAFNGGTPVVLDSTNGPFGPYAAAMSPLIHDILWAGHYQNSTSQGGAINVYRSDGSLDPNVVNGGEITLTADQAGSSFAGGNLYWYAIAVDDQGRILAAGMVVNNSGSPAMILTRFMSDGTLDTAFGANGTGIVTAALNNYAFADGLSLTADGHILVTGTAVGVSTTPVQLTVWRFNPDGTADTAFGSNGHVQIAAVSDTSYEICFPALQPDGALIAGCQLRTAKSWRLTRLTAAGTVDTAFGTSGLVTGAANRQLAGLALAPDGGFVISELDTAFSPPTLYLRRYLANGTVDPGFTGGVALGGSIPNGVARVPVAVQPDGKILISSNGGGYNLLIGRYLANGQGDTGFGSGGTSTIDFSSIGGQSYTPNPTALLLQGDGRIIASGWAGTSASIYTAFVTRVTSDPYDLTPSTLTFNAVTRAPLGQAVTSNAANVSGVSIGGNASVYLALVTLGGKYGSSTSGPFAGAFTGTNGAWTPAGSALTLEQMTPSTGGTDTTTNVVLGGFWAANNYEIPLGSPATASWTITTDQPPVASNGTLSATTAKASTGTLSATNPSSGTLAFAIVTAPAHGTVTVTAATGAYSYTSTASYTGSDSFTWKVNDGVADSNIATVSVAVKTPPPPPSGGGGGGGGFGPLALLGLLFLALVPWWLRRCGTRSTPTQPTENTAMKPRRARDSIALINLQDTQLREDIPMKLHLKLRFLVSTLAVLMLSLAALPALAAPGDIDPGFNGGTPVILDMNSSGVSFDSYAAAMNPLNGDILWAGDYQNPTSQGGTIVVYKPNGTFDSAVGNSGAIKLTPAQAGFTGGELYLYAIAVDGQGRILAAGDVINAGSTTWAMVLARFKPDGTLDTAFGTAGTGIVVDPLNTFAEGRGLSLTADGHILVTGDAYNAGHTAYPLTVWRFNPDGTADTAFGSTGLVQIAAIDNMTGFRCFPALQPNGALIAGCDKGTAASWKLTRLQADGTVDTGFGTSGYLTGAANRALTGLALAPDGGFVISEKDTNASPPPLDMRRYVANGTVDTGFNSGNPLALGFVTSWVQQVPVAVQPDGKILLSFNNGGTHIFVERYLATGTADTSFGTNGFSNIDFGSIGGHNYTPYPAALLVQGNGRIVASGWANSTAGSNEAGFVTRVLSDAYDLMPTTPAFTAVARAPLGQALASNAVAVSGVSIGSATSGFRLALTTVNGKYSTSGGAPFAGGYTGTNGAWTPAGGSLALEQMTPTTGGTDTTTTVVLGGFWAANNYEVPLGSPATASWTTTTDQPPLASDGTLNATTAKASAGTLTATNPSSGTLAFAIVTAPAHGTVTVTAATGAYSYTSTAGYTGNDTFTWKVNDGVADSNLATVNVTVKKAPPPPSGGGGSLGVLGLLALALLGGSTMFRKRCTS